MDHPPTPVRAVAFALDQDMLTKRHGLSLSELARRSGLAVETVRKQQRVHTYPAAKVPTIDLEKAQRIADVLGKSVVDLFCHPNGDAIGGDL